MTRYWREQNKDEGRDEVLERSEQGRRTRRGVGEKRTRKKDMTRCWRERKSRGADHR